MLLLSKIYYRLYTVFIHEGLNREEKEVLNIVDRVYAGCLSECDHADILRMKEAESDTLELATVIFSLKSNLDWKLNA